MILYDGKQWRSLLKCRGSVVLRSVPYALPISVIAYFVKHGEVEGWFDLKESEIIKNSAAYGGFTASLAFFLIFRSSLCYQRFWVCATGACTMRAQMEEAVTSLLSYTLITQKPKEETRQFQHLVVRLFSLLHAFALQNICDMEDEDFPAIDVAGIEPKYLKLLASMDIQERVGLVYGWINALIIKSVKSGLIGVPHPIVSRVFQELEQGMVEYNQVLQIMRIPFPFPYAQIAIMLLVIYMACTPIVMSYYVGQPWASALITFISVLCFVSIELIASELENPLGDDANDLPAHEWQDEFNDSLISFLHPCAHDLPKLSPSAVLDHAALSACLRPFAEVVNRSARSPLRRRLRGHPRCKRLLLRMPEAPRRVLLAARVRTTQAQGRALQLLLLLVAPLRKAQPSSGPTRISRNLAHRQS